MPEGSRYKISDPEIQKWFQPFYERDKSSGDAWPDPMDNPEISPEAAEAIRGILYDIAKIPEGEYGLDDVLNKTKGWREGVDRPPPGEPTPAPTVAATPTATETENPYPVGSLEWEIWEREHRSNKAFGG